MLVRVVALLLNTSAFLTYRKSWDSSSPPFSAASWVRRVLFSSVADAEPFRVGSGLGSGSGPGLFVGKNTKT
jgi:hypothetical protein